MVTMNPRRMVGRPLTIVGLGDSTTAGTPGFKSPIEAPPDGAGNPESQYAYWLMQMRPQWRGPETGRDPQTGAPTPRRLPAGACVADRGRALPCPAAAAPHWWQG